MAPQLQGAATEGFGGSFVPLPRILWCWVSFARAFRFPEPLGDPGARAFEVFLKVSQSLGVAMIIITDLVPPPA